MWLGTHHYTNNRAFHEIYAQSVAAYALWFDDFDEIYLDDWASNMHCFPPIDWDKLRAVVAIVGEHMRAALNTEATK